MGNTAPPQTLKDCAALGESVTVTGYNSPNIGRVSGIVYGTRSNNHAYDAMKLFSNTVYGPDDPDYDPDNGYPPGHSSEITTLLPAPAHNNVHGADAPASRFKERSFWDHRGLDFSDDNWLFTTVGRGESPEGKIQSHPILRGPLVNGVPGGALGGQLE
jgi:hypothetical protein